MEMKISFPGGKKVYADYKGFTIKTDQPKNEEGEETAPEPFSLFIASIGTCVGFYVMSFCQQRLIPTDNLSLIVTPEENNQTGMIESISIDVNLPKEFPDTYTKAIIKTANLCTVKKHLLTPPQINIQVKK